VDKGQLLEKAILTQRREDLLWRATGDDRHRDMKMEALREARKIAGGLSAHLAAAAEAHTVAEINKRLSALQSAETAKTVVPVENLHTMVDDLIKSVHDYLEQNKSQLESTVQSAWRMHHVVDLWGAGVLLLVMVILVGGSWGLVVRVVRPTMDLTQAASRFGRGDVSTRVPVRRDDELGTLCRTFNTMADDVENAEKMRLQFVASVAHDLKNPLVTIGGAARVLKKRTLDPDQAKEWLNRIIAQVLRLENLTLDLMDTVQVSTGQLSLNKTELDLTELIRGVHQEQVDLGTTHSLVFEGEKACKVVGDRNRLERVAFNLISNALKYSPENSSVRLRVEQRGAEAVFVVRDEGAGMSAEEIEVAFQPFGRGSRTQNMAKGTGMGLCIVKSIVEAHGGRITLESEMEKGTTVEVSLPLAQG